MDGDFIIESAVPDGVRCLEPFLSKAPVDLAVGRDQGFNAEVLIQTSVSRVDGFLCESVRGERHIYGVFVHDAHSGDPGDVLLQFSKIFRDANLTHRIFRIIHELDEEEEIVAYDTQA